MGKSVTLRGIRFLVVLFCFSGCASMPSDVGDTSSISPKATLTGNNKSKISSESRFQINRLKSVWPRVRSLLLDSTTHIPDGLEIATEAEIQFLVSTIDSNIENEEWDSVWESWWQGDFGSGSVLMSINWKYGGNRRSGDGTEPYREYERWHVREFEKATVLLSNDQEAIKTTTYWYGTLKRTVKPKLP